MRTPDWNPAAAYAAVYELLITQRERSETDLARRLPMHNATEIHDALLHLQHRELAVPIDATHGTWEALPPSCFINQRLNHLENQLANERTNFTGMLEEFWKARSRTITSYAEVEPIRERHQIVRTFFELQNTARQQVRGMNRPPYVVPDDSDEEDLSLTTQLRRLSEGIDYRLLYETSLLTTPHDIPMVLKTISHGEQARTLATLPMKFVACDDAQALVVLDPPKNPHDVSALLIRRSGLLTALLNVFEALWDAATPLAGRSIQTLDAVDRTILTMMVGGSTDEAIGLAVGMSRRTVARRCATLFTRLGASNRFQAGAQAVRRGWL